VDGEAMGKLLQTHLNPSELSEAAAKFMRLVPDMMYLVWQPAAGAGVMPDPATCDTGHNQR